MRVRQKLVLLATCLIHKTNLAQPALNALKLDDPILQHAGALPASAAAYAEPRVVIGASTSGKFAVKGLLIDEFTGKQVKLHLYKVLFTSNGEVVLLSEDDTEAQEIAMTLTPEIPTGCSSYGTIDGLPLRVGSL